MDHEAVLAATMTKIEPLAETSLTPSRVHWHITWSHMEVLLNHPGNLKIFQPVTWTLSSIMMKVQSKVSEDEYELLQVDMSWSNPTSKDV